MYPCTTAKLFNKTPREEASQIRKPAPYTFLILTLFLLAVVQEHILLFDWRSSGVAETDQWYKQYPSFAEMLTDSKTNGLDEYNFAYDNNSAQLVIGVNSSRPEGYAEIEKIVYQENGEIVNTILIGGRICSIVVNVPTQHIPSFLAHITVTSQAKYVEPNWKLHIDANPNDPKWSNQWGPQKIEADLAWDTQIGKESVLVAIIDTGIDYNHEDLAANYVSLGYDWVNSDTDPMDDNGHGTHCAGIIAAVLNNSVGIGGIARVRIMAEKGFNSRGWGYEDDLAEAIIHAVDQGANILSNSWGGSENALIHEAIQYACDHDVLVIAAAGNDGSSLKSYPAGFDEVVAVSATDSNDNPAWFTNYGDWIELAAPGVSIYSTFPENRYKQMSGTSMACPHVAGVAALVWSQFPTMSCEQVRAQLCYAADDVGEAGFDVYYGYGRVNAKKAVENTLCLVGSKILKAPANTVYFPYVFPTQATRAATAYDAITSGVIYGLCEHAQWQGFTARKNWLLDCGAINSTTINNATVVFTGGPCAQTSVNYYENEGLTPIKFDANDTHCMFINQTGMIVAAISQDSISSGHEDLFVIEIFADGDNFFLIIYGFEWKGTWAGGICLKEIISSNINCYSKTCYIFHWLDDQEQDGIPQSSEIHMEYSPP